MPQTPPDLYCFLGRAVAGDPAPYRPGACHALVAFTAARGGLEEAQEVLARETRARGWHDLEIVQSTAFPSGPDALDPGPARRAAEDALRHGASVIVHPDELSAAT
ncbi:hypothetical protein [Jannaschia formosa]|uniref:hypothetical protein n=1 Tax=Jannaschia formosa TaxID=2259592 RepID=UPI000E1BEFEE|nr:hypothetical protein [Jannaschia formosa]TFL19644.1 hypothetical protein DR046_03845 [Jannaschia formosa]